jgi:hypothetical protein
MIVEDFYALITEEELQDGKAPISVMVEDVYTLIVEEVSQAYDLISDETLQAFDMIAEETSRFLLFLKLLGETHSLLHPNNIVKELTGKSKHELEAPVEALHPLFFSKRLTASFVKEGSAMTTPSKDEGEEAQEQEEARAREAPDETVKARNVKDDVIQDEAVRAKEVTEEEAVDQEKAQDQDEIEKFRAGESQDDENVEEEDFF